MPDDSVNAFDAAKRPDDQTEFCRLAKLPPADYDRTRKEAAERLGIQRTTLDREVARLREKPEKETAGSAITWPEEDPWVEPVNGDALLDEIADTLSCYVVLPVAERDAVALWLLMTWLHADLEVAPFLHISSAVKRSGKSTLADVLASLVYRPLSVSGRISAAAMFRIIERDAPTLLMDEADTFMRDDPELNGIINGSQRKSSAYVVRCVGDDFEPHRFTTWAAKAIIGIGNLPDTVTDRSIPIRLERKGQGDPVTLWRHRSRDEIDEVRARLARWIDDERTGVLHALRRVEFPRGMDDRQQDSWEALLAIAHVAGGNWPERAQIACTTLCSSVADTDSAREVLLNDIYDLFVQHGDPTALETTVILAYLNGLESRPWPEWSRGKEMSASALAKQLRPFGISPGSVRLDAGRNLKGYKRDSLVSVWKSYLPPSVAVTTSQPAELRQIPQILSVTKESGVTDKKMLKPPLTNGCDVVTDTTPPLPGNAEISDLERAERAVIEDDANERAALQDEFPPIPEQFRA